MLKKLVLALALPVLATTAGAQGICNPSVFIGGNFVVGGNVEICARSAIECRGCLLISATPGPTVAGPYVIPVGMPVVAEIPVPILLTGELCWRLPWTSNLAGQTFYLSFIATRGTNNPIEISPVAVLNL